MKIERQKFTRTMPDDAEIVATQVFGPIPLRRCTECLQNDIFLSLTQVLGLISLRRCDLGVD